WPEPQRPEEADPVEEAEEKRWIAQRRQQAAGVADDDDEEDRQMRVMLALAIDTEERANEDHAGAGRTDDVRQHSADAEEDRVGARPGGNVAIDKDASRDHVECRQQNDEGGEFPLLVQQLPGAFALSSAIDGQQINRHRQREADRDQRLVAVGMPPVP